MVLKISFLGCIENSGYSKIIPTNMCINRNGTTMSKLEQQDPNENSRKIFDGYDTTDKENSIKRDPENEKKENNERHEETTHPQPTPIAICGMSLRLPGNLRTPSDLFSFLLNHHDARASPDHVRYNANTHGHSKSPQSSEGYFLRHAGKYSGFQTRKPRRNLSSKTD